MSEFYGNGLADALPTSYANKSETRIRTAGTLAHWSVSSGP